jgi:hypothetical protein
MNKLNIERNTAMAKMRRDGHTYAEIAEEFGVSKQRVYQLIGQGDKRYFHTVSEKRCIWKGIREWMNDNRIGVSPLVRKMYGNANPTSQNRISGYLAGEIELRKEMIDILLDITGLTYEEAFRRE